MDEGTINSLADLEFKDVSGFSNNTLIVTNKNAKKESEKPSKLVVRFFESAGADLAAESATFRLMGEKGLGPKEYFVDEKMRVEECIAGRALEMVELRNPHLSKAIIEALCDMNYDQDLIAASRRIKGQDSIFLRDLTSETGWLSLLKQMRQASNFATVEDPDVKAIQQFFDGILQDSDSFAADFKACLPKNCREGIDIVFSHNDFQENNTMLCGNDYTKVVLIDFEYSQMNYRGADLAAYFNEVMITYNHAGQIPFKIYYDWMLTSAELNTVMEIYLGRYHTKFYKGDDTLEQFLAHEKPILLEQIRRCVLLTHAMWAFGSLLLLPSFETKPVEFMGYHLYAWARLEMLQEAKKHFLREHFPSLAIA